MTNLKHAFPEKSEEERIRIARKFFRHFMDMVLETVKGLTISEKALRKKIYCINAEVLDELADKKENIILSGLHYGNYEYVILAHHPLFKHASIGVGKPLTNPYFDKKITARRSRFGMMIVSAKNVREVLKEHHNKGMSSLFLGDQWPGGVDKSFITEFLGKETCFHFGIEHFAKKHNSPVYYLDVEKPRRGKYQLTVKLITDSPQEEEHSQILLKYIKCCEETINREPAYWLWSHRRWKHVKGLYKKRKRRKKSAVRS